MAKGSDAYEVALKECAEAKQRWERLQASIEAEVLDPELVGALLATVSRGLYRHFKGGLYVVETVVYDVNGMFDPSVDYTALYGALVGFSAGRILYGKDAFLEPIDRAGYKGRRFTRLRKLSVLESAKLRANAKHISRGATPEAQLRRAERLLDPMRAR